MTVRRDKFLFAAVVGSGLTAKVADEADADYLLALNAGRFRFQGASSLTSFLPVRSANEWVMEFAEREMLGRCKAPIYAGLSVADPTLDIPALVAKVRGLGFAGVCNFPSTSLIDGRLGALFEEEGLGHSRELALVRETVDQGLAAFAYVQTNAQARQMVEAGATAICVNIGFTSGATGVNTHLTLETAASMIDRVLEGVPASISKLCHGGPITSPEEALAVTRMCGVQGFVAGSTLDRLPMEQTLSEVTKGFTAIPSLSRIKTEQAASKHDLIGSSVAMQSIREQLGELAFEDIPVLFTGETGTGKSRAALWLHTSSPAARRHPVVVDCPALDAESGGAHLLGTAPGSHSGANQRGALEQASGSSVILDEIAALSPDLQGKLLKFADEKTVQRIGDHTLRKADARIMATTSETLADRVEDGRFRRDLLYRIAGHEIALPPLRARVDDIAELALFLAKELRGDQVKFSNAALRRLQEHDWPGNVRELSFAVSRAIRQTEGLSVGLKALEFLRRPSGPRIEPEETAPPAAMSERDWIAKALARNAFRRAQTAEDLGMTTRTLYNKIKKYQLEG